jgi:LacI family transcriptional regulator
MPNRVTLADVAARAGVSRTTASFVLSGRRDMRISAAAEERVLRAARELDYRPNLLARGLKDNLSQSIGLISDVVATEPFAGQVVRGSIATALQNGHLLFVGETEGDPELERRLVREMVDRGVGGILYATNSTRRVTLSATLKEQRLVLVNCTGGGRSIPSVIPDDRGGGRAAVEALLEAGHADRIHLVGETPQRVIAGRDRRAGVETALRDAGLELAGSTDCIWWPEAAYTATTAVLRDNPSALICLNDRVAFGAYQAIADAGLRIPDDISVISFDDSDLAAWLRPGLTSIGMPYFEMGRRAVEVMLDRDSVATTQRVPMTLRHRESVAAPRKRLRRAR